MKRLLVSILIVHLCLVPSCSSTPVQYTALESRVVDTVDIHSILIQVDDGEVTVLKSESDQVKIEGQVLFANALEYQVNVTEKQIEIKVFAHRDNSPKVPLGVVVRVPQGMQVKVETDKASVLVQEYQGELDVDSISGDITVERMTGAMTLHSNRGNITVQKSSGDISVVGNYGALTVQNTSGETAVSTIMGNIVSEGRIQADDIVRLETDHGAVSVLLSADSSLGIHVRSTSGDVACMVPGMTSTTRTCDGTMNSGGGNLSIRTVSGAVTLQLIP
jgi:hypothetical protein